MSDEREYLESGSEDMIAEIEGVVDVVHSADGKNNERKEKKKQEKLEKKAEKAAKKAAEKAEKNSKKISKKAGTDPNGEGSNGSDDVTGTNGPKKSCKRKLKWIRLRIFKKEFKIPNLISLIIPSDDTGENRRTGGLPIKVQLIIGFLIPVLFIVLIGMLSYQRSSKGLIQLFEQSSYSTLNMTMNSLDQAFSSIQATVIEVANSQDVKSYALGGYKGDEQKNGQAMKNLQQMINTKSAATKIISEIDIMPIQNLEIPTTRNLSFTNLWYSFMDDFEKSEDAYILDSKLKAIWGTSHPYWDSATQMDNYCMFCAKAINAGKLHGFVMIDVDGKEVQNMMSEANFGDEAYIWFVTAEGGEICNREGLSYSELNLKDVTDDTTTTYIRVKGKKYFFMQSLSEVNGSRLVAIVPESYITASSDSIRTLTIFIILISVIIAIFIAAIIITGIAVNINRNIKKLDMVSGGDLSVSEGSEKISRNEFGKLQLALRNTIIKMRDLIGTVTDSKNAVVRSGDKVAASTDELSTMIENVSAQVEEINAIIASQNGEIADCNEQMEGLSSKIKNVSSSIYSTIDEVNKSKEAIDSGMVTVNSMVDQSSRTAATTKEVQEKVIQLTDKLVNIEGFANNIKEIASQTNLLSLNASIEAARAGEHGRGFSVVAEEIRKLADNSGKTAVQIKKMVEEITVYSNEVLDKVKEADDISTSQVDSAKQTIEAFNNMNEVMTRLADNMSVVSGEVEGMNESRHETLKSIKKIEEQSESTVVATNEVNDYLDKQMQSAGYLRDETNRLQDNMSELEKALSTFKI
ncbi:MAG: methyl-accepting chemotaxis protein [Lachnospiraceae bacterium]|nr:methyl-accepting chemotaxis protein [Lachnospiraceae bacterium]